MSDGVPRVDEIFSRAVAAQLAEQQAQRETFAELERRLEVVERLVTDGLGEVAKLLRAGESEHERLGERLAGLETGGGGPPLDLDRRFEGLEQALVERLARQEAMRQDDLRRRLTSLELSMAERVAHLEETLGVDDLGRRVEALESMMAQRLAVLESAVRDDDTGRRLESLEGSLHQFEEQTASRLEELRQASTAAEVGILERIIAESHVVGAHFEAVRPAVEAVAEARPDLETTLGELRRMAENVRAGEAEAADGTPESGPYSAAELCAVPNEEENLFLPPEETPIPDRRFGLPRRDK